MRLLAIEKEVEGVDWSNESETLKKEAEQVYRLYLAGYIREIYFNEFHNAIIILECESEAQANELIGLLPLFQKGLIKFDVMQLKPYTGFERIFSL